MLSFRRFQVSRGHLSHRRRWFLALTAILFAMSCSNEEAVCCGYAILFQGGSKVSLVQRGFVIESYIVTGIYEARNLTVFEVHPYDSEECRYRVAMMTNRLTPRLTRNQLNHVRPGLLAAIEGPDFERIGSRSCIAAANSK